MFCPECGCKLESGAKFCPECGFKIDIAPMVTDVANFSSSQEVAISTPSISTPTTEVVMVDDTYEKQQQHKKYIQQTGAYSLANGIAKYLDGYYIDPVVGFIPVVGDISPFVLSLPSIYIALIHLKSIPLVLAMIFNVLVDVVVGMIPFYIGNVLDIFLKAYKRNMKLIDGWLDNDKKVKEEVKSKAVIIAILIVVVCLIIYWLATLIGDIADSFTSCVRGLFD